MSLSSPAPHRDVQWIKDGLGRTQPAWNTQPSLPLLESIARDHLSIPADTPCPISPFARGAFNELYVVHTPERACLIRVTLPVQPRLKTLSEVATIEFVRAHAFELVPRVLAYDADARPPERGGLGFEWMIMEKIPGSALQGCWEDMDWGAKLSLVKTIVGILAKLYDHPLSGVGNIYPATADAVLDDMAPPTSHTVGQIISMTFFWDDHFDQDVPRGPFISSHDWLAACLQFILNDIAKVIDRAQALEEAEETKALAERLVRLLPRVFPPAAADAPPERTVIFHDDLSSQNILVDASGTLTGLVDWECVSALPLWRACTLPWFLIGRHRAERPNPETYGRAEDEDDGEDGNKDGDGNGSGRPNSLYFEHLLEWEQTRLRAVFLAEMERVRPEWVGVHRAGVLRNDFYTAMMHCDDELSRRRVRQWVDRVEAMADEELQGGALSSEYVSLNDMLLS
ncbi:kinase-like protein [Ganoderma leucocontextum]|nr:kinase-like protein [Ganoderma leucocontextum]